MKTKKLLTLISVFLITTFVACGSTKEKLPDKDSLLESIAATQVSMDNEQEVIEDKTESDTNQQEFILGYNLEDAIVEMTLAFVDFDSATNTKEEYYTELFIDKYCQNSRMSFDYLDKVAEENDGMISREEVEYMQLSLTNEFVDFQGIVPEEGIDSRDSSSGFNFGHIISYSAEVNEDEVNLVAEFERGKDGSENTNLYELNIILIKNPESCFDGYSIKSLTSKDITPVVYGDNQEHTVNVCYMGIEDEGIFTFENYGGEDDIKYDMFIEVDLSDNPTLADFVRENEGSDFDITYLFDDSMTEPVYKIVPTDIKIHGESNVIENLYLLSTSEEFYNLIASNPIDQKYEADSGEATLETVQRAYEACDVWNQQIDYTGAQLSSLLNDNECDKLQNVIEAWKDFYQEKVSMYQSLFGMNGIIPGSMYTQIAADILVEENRLMAFALLSLEYELSQDIQFVIENEEDNANSGSISRYDFSEENVCIEYCQDFEEMLDSYSLDEKSSEELEVLINETADNIQEKIGEDYGFNSYVNKYVSIINTLNEIEEQIAADDRYITVKENRLRLYATQLLNIEFMLEEL